jgi:predicted nucleotidyltransferase
MNLHLQHFNNTHLNHQQYCSKVSKDLFDYYTAQDNNPHHVVFTTVHGSHLYNTHNNTSDLDCYVVLDQCKNNQKVNEQGYDVARFNLKMFLSLLNEGSHQAAEALFSPYAVWNTQHPYFHMLKHTRPSVFAFARKSLSAAKKFKLTVTDELVEQKLHNPLHPAQLTPNHEKKLLHAARLEHKTNELLKNGFSTYSPVFVQ